MGQNRKECDQLSMKSKNNVSIDKRKIEFLNAVYFGKYADPYEAASNRAYRDMNRTIRFRGMEPENRKELRRKTTQLLKESIQNVLSVDGLDQKVFDKWHEDLCMTIIDCYKKASVVLTCGQAQKWVNMTLKYLYVLDEDMIESVFQYCHVPLDNYIFDYSEKIYGIGKPKTAWSRWTDYKKDYMAYQDALRRMINDDTPLGWEFEAWIKASRK